MTNDGDTGKIIFHGTKQPAGTSCRTLRPPSIFNPFFITDNVHAAKWYAGMSGGSVFILRLVNGWENSLFDFNDRSDLNEIEKAGFPLTFKMLIGKMSKSSFFDVSVDVSNFIDLVLSKSPKIRKGNSNWNNYKEIFNSCVELGLLDDGMIETDVLKSLIDKNEGRRAYRKAFKSRIYDLLLKRGYKIFKDKDTTSKGFKGNEYAILDLSVIKDGLDLSVKISKVNKVLNMISLAGKWQDGEVRRT